MFDRGVVRGVRKLTKVMNDASFIKQPFDSLGRSTRERSQGYPNLLVWLRILPYRVAKASNIEEGFLPEEPRRGTPLQGRGYKTTLP